jgi:hypothetical protein
MKISFPPARLHRRLPPKERILCDRPDMENSSTQNGLLDSPHALRTTQYAIRNTQYASRLTLHAPRSTLHASAIALVITLILLSVITFMAVTFLVLSRAQRGAVTTTTEQAIAKYAADSAQQQAIADVMAPIIASTNEFNYGLRVSTNYISAAGYTKNNNTVTNVNYNYNNGAPITGNDALQNLQNLFILPRPPVWVTNRLGASNEFRFFLDLNRNQRFETNGLLPVMNPKGGFYDLTGNRIDSPIAGNTLSNFFVGDPEWIGVLERPDLPHSATNRFVARYAYMVVPASKALDINAVHNYAKGPSAPFNPFLTAGKGDGFFRNQGVGPWEMNLAAFLVDLNTNYWPYPLGTALGAPYLYDTNTVTANTGTAFDDALSLLRYRYAANTSASLASAGVLFPPVGLLHPFNRDFIDGYSHGPLMTGLWWPPTAPFNDADNTRINLSWSGAENTNHFFTTQDLFDKTKTAITPKAGMTFPDRLLSAGTNLDSYNRYTFYRFAEQMGSDAAVERGKINLNYVNVDAQGRVVPNMQTNFIAWTPVQFFTNVAIRMLVNAGYAVGSPASGVGNLTNLLGTNNFGLTNLQIQVWPTNFYTPSVHRLLQVAANIYDATTNQGDVYPYYPSVFAPMFNRAGTNVYITGYRSITNAADILTAQVLDPSRPRDLQLIKPGIPQVLYGVPLVVGAKKGFPNFNEYLMQTHVRVTRKLEFRRPTATADVNETNVMYVLSVTNAYGLEAWNSYQSNYTRSLQCIAVATMMAVVTNTVITNNMVDPPLQPFQWNFTAVYGPTNVSPWTGYYPLRPATSFRIPFAGAFAFFTNHTCFDTNSLFFPEATPFVRHIGSSYFPVPHWWFNLRTRVRFILVDTGTTPNRIVDYVNLDTQEPPLDLTYTLMQDTPGHPIVGTNDNWVPAGQNASYWITNRYPVLSDVTHPTQGIMNQWDTCMGQITPNTSGTSAGTWNDITGRPISADNTGQAIHSFQIQFQPGNEAFKSNIFYAPFAPTREVYYLTSWQANDPLVHYMIDDLVTLDTANQTNRFQFLPGKQFSASDIMTNIGANVNDRYDPWPTGSDASKATNFDITLKDPQLRAGPYNIVGSDSWEFPTNKFPNIGWLGRVHRGTPWQTIYLKAGAAQPATWIKWTGNTRYYPNVGQFQTNIAPIYIPNVPSTYPPVFDAMLTHPTNDYYLLDLFTTSFSDNSARGKMSVNQTNLAAWSALLSGVALLTNSALPGGSYLPTPVIVQPAGVYDPFNTNTWPPLVQLVNGINRTRTNLFLNSRGQFDRLGDILKVPELTVNSPFFNFNTNALRSPANVVNDAVMERLPQQILGLLQDDPAPRFVIYAFGQALKPAGRSLITSGPYFGLCTNYQVVAEAATRAVVRVDGIPKFQPPAPRLASFQPLQFASPLIVRNPMTNLNVVIEQFNVLPPE